MGKAHAMTKNRIAYGSVAQQYKEVLAEETLRQKMQDKKGDAVIVSPQQRIMSSRVLKYRKSVERYSKNYCFALIDTHDYTISVRNETDNLFRDYRMLSHGQFSAERCNEVTRNIVRELSVILEETDNNPPNVQMIPRLLRHILDRVTAFLADPGRSPAATLKIFTKSHFLSGLPEGIQDRIISRLVSMGLNPEDQATLKSILTQLGVDPETIVSEISLNGVPKQLERLL